MNYDQLEPLVLYLLGECSKNINKSVCTFDDCDECNLVIVTQLRYYKYID